MQMFDRQSSDYVVELSIVLSSIVGRSGQSFVLTQYPITVGHLSVELVTSRVLQEVAAGRKQLQLVEIHTNRSN